MVRNWHHRVCKTANFAKRDGISIKSCEDCSTACCAQIYGKIVVLFHSCMTIEVQIFTKLVIKCYNAKSLSSKFFEKMNERPLIFGFLQKKIN